MVTSKSKKIESKLITIVVPVGIYNKLEARKKKDGATFHHQVNAILAHYFFGNHK